MVKYANTLKTRSGLSGKNPSVPFAVTINWITIPAATTRAVTPDQTPPSTVFVMPEMYDAGAPGPGSQTDCFSRGLLVGAVDAVAERDDGVDHQHDGPGPGRPEGGVVPAAGQQAEADHDADTDAVREQVPEPAGALRRARSGPRFGGLTGRGPPRKYAAQLVRPLQRLMTEADADPDEDRGQ